MGSDAYREPFGSVIGDSQVMREVLSSARKLAQTDIPVLLSGESGTGKKLLGRLIHESSRSSKGPFVPVDCTAIPKDLLESELFGYEKGAFTGAYAQHKGYLELAHGGSLFLDRVAELTQSVQLRVARFLQEQVIQRLGGREQITVNTRVLATTDEGPKPGVKDSLLESDLYLNFVAIQLPLLRERENDVLLLADAFLKKYANERGIKVHGFTSHAKDAMMYHTWPGNVRELETRVRRAVFMADGSRITPADLGLEMSATGHLPDHAERLTLKEAREALEKEMISKALSRLGGNVTRAAEELGISRPTLYELMEKLGIPRKNWSEPPQEAETEPLHKHSSAIPWKALGPDHPDVATRLNDLAALYEALGKYAEAEPLYKRALEISKQALGPDHPDVATILERMSVLYRKTGRKTAAEELEKRAAIIRQSPLFTVKDKEN